MFADFCGEHISKVGTVHHVAFFWHFLHVLCISMYFRLVYFRCILNSEEVERLTLEVEATRCAHFYMQPHYSSALFGISSVHLGIFGIFWQKYE